MGNSADQLDPAAAQCPVCEVAHEPNFTGPDRIAPCTKCITESTWMFTDQVRLTPQPGEVLVSIDLEEENPLFPATIADERWNGFAIPSFRRDVAEAVLAWTNYHHLQHPDAGAYGYWMRDTLMLTETQWADEPGFQPECIDPDVDGRYPIGARNWTWELDDSDPSVAANGPEA